MTHATRCGRVDKERLSQRKRAPVACQFCRLRKTRCDGAKPICGFCQHHEAQCIWGTTSDNNEEKEKNSEQTILQRLDEIKDILRDMRAPTATKLQFDSQRPVTASPSTLEPPTSTIDTKALHVTTSDSSAAITSSFARIRCESLLAWPIFRSIVDPELLAVESFVLESGEPDLQDCSLDVGPSNPGMRARRAGIGIPEERVVSLCQKFLIHVHARNPVLSADKLLSNARRVAEHGLQWDSSSCLVLIACSLACYTTPFKSGTTNNTQNEGEDAEDIELAETFYLAAKQRFGLLRWSLIDIQCLFFASVAEKCRMNPLQAWFHIQQASSRLKAHLRRVKKPRTASDNDNTFSGINQELQRLFWSVYRAEHELLIELPFNSSGLEDFTRVDSMFPVLPKFEPASDEMLPSTTYSEERSWAFYSAEISIRRTMTDTILTLYRKGEDYWLTHSKSLIRQCQLCEQEIWAWYSHLPPSIRFDQAGQPDNELSFYLQGRFDKWRIYVSMPVLYYVLHRTESQELAPEVLKFAQDSIAVYANSIVHTDQQNRHGGTWLCCRNTFSLALLILGVVLKADASLVPPRNWNQIVLLSISTLKKWESCAPDIYMLRTTLEQLWTAVHHIVHFTAGDPIPRP
ncbi:hypothetical protein OPT61_g5025 [Boeremia exigua]|uniref:Uncharacterized protein n=1 Tax=Boeremia exigua TaxID=749465 RepID=A0ACC2IBS7_9PLEO|nr:hypothetical protein OPT61_g5025 [Boeremia exigua]